MRIFQKISIIIPAYNEALTIGKLVRSVSQADTLGLEKEIILVDDGSTDSTHEQAKSVKAKSVRVVGLTKNSGKGQAIIEGLKMASGDIILIQDADLEYQPADYPALLKPIMDRRTRVVYGSREMRRNRYSYPAFYFGGKLITGIANWLYRAQLTDISTGYKIFDSKLLKLLKPTSAGFEFCAEMTAKLLRSRELIIEVPITYTPRSFAEGKKIRAIDGLKAIITLLRLRIFP